ncbi:transposase-like protein, IS1381 ISSpn7 [Streptococcus pneumoniae]|nr:transposase-like protein, IS1381 ISSpn7 [Streptococcus pneumoniae]
MRRKYKSIALKKELANDSGKKKCHAMKAQAIVTSQGRIVSLDIAVNYCHDMKLFKMSRRNIGQAGKILADSGYQGLMKIYPQAQTPRKSSKLKPTYEEIAADLGIHESNLIRRSQWVEVTLVQSGVTVSRTPLSSEDTVMIDATEVQINRPKKRISE